MRRTLRFLIVGLALATLPVGSERQQSPLQATQPQLPQVSGFTFDRVGEPALSGFALPAAAGTVAPIGPAADIARVINASTPFAPQRASPSRPFLAVSDLTDHERATDCLAAAGFYEAGGKAEDQRAVMQVILNRVRHNNFPNSICGVVFQGSERRTGCQFTFTCDGAMLRRHPSAAAWRQARMVAMEMMTGRVEPVVGQATHYHTNWVHPSWSAQMQKIAAVDTHLFFRWRGGQGEPRAFSARYSGAEPHIAKMAWLSFARRSDPTPAVNAPSANAVQFVLPDTAAIGRIENALITVREPIPDRAHAPDPDVFLTTLDAAADPDSFLRLAQRSCAGKATCRFLGWTDPARKAELLPVSGAAIDAMSFSYIRQGPDDPGKARWNCTQFPRGNQAQCLQRGG